jgi:hypothetical protein
MVGWKHPRQHFPCLRKFKFPLQGRSLDPMAVAQWSEIMSVQCFTHCRSAAQAGAAGPILIRHPLRRLLVLVSAENRWEERL